MMTDNVQKINMIISDHLAVPLSSVIKDAELSRDLGMAEKDFSILIRAMESEFNIEIPDGHCSWWSKVSDFYNYGYLPVEVKDAETDINTNSGNTDNNDTNRNHSDSWNFPYCT